MSQTVDHMTSKHTKIEVSPDNAGPWADISGGTTAGNPSGGDHKTGEKNTFGSSVPITGIGKRNAVTVALTTVYTATASEAYDVLHGYFETQAVCWLRISPDGAGAPAVYFKGRGHISACPGPSPDADSGDILVAEATWFGNELEWQGGAT